MTEAKYLKCYYCNFSTDIDSEYQQHVKSKHPNKPVYPTSKQIRELKLKSQEKFWEYLGIDN